MLKFFFLKNRLLYTHGNIAKIVHTISFLAFFPKNEITFENFGQELCMLRKKIRPQKYILTNCPKLLLIICAITLPYFRMTLHFLHSDTF